MIERVRVASARLLPACLAALAFGSADGAARGPGVQDASPTGTVAGVQQLSMRFATPMVAFGEPRAAPPVTLECAAAGRGRWLDPRHWVHDFDSPLPSGLRCRYALRNRLSDAAGAALPPASFAFDTGGPRVLQSEPWSGSEIDEEQIFLLGLDGPANPQSIEQHARCRAEGLVDAVGVRLLTGAERQILLDANPWFLRRYAQSVHGARHATALVPASAAEEDEVAERYRALASETALRIAVLQCRQRLPNGARASLDWGAGIASPSGLATRVTSTLDYEVRPAFRAVFHCERVNAEADCIPALPMSLDFTAPVSREAAAAIGLSGADGTVYAQAPPEDARASHVSSVRFAGPFPPRGRFTLRLPDGLVDDAGRSLANAARFPREVRTDEDPPLAKFAADFGIVELAGTPALPVTVRNLEGNLLRLPPAPQPAPASVGGFVRDLAERALGRRDESVLANPVVTSLRGRLLALDASDPRALGHWLQRVRDAQQDEWEYDETREEYVVTRRAGERVLLAGEAGAKPLEVPRQSHAKAFEVVAIPLPAPGLYVVELASPRLGASLFGKPGVYHTQALALVTNLGVHLKWGRESSLVWVTALDSGQPVPRAEVTIADCAGKPLWRGRTDGAGIAAVAQALPPRAELPECEWNSRGLVAIARLGPDTGLVASDWNEGIANWQFSLPGPQVATPDLGHAVLDRSLFRAGETVHMKLFFRRHGGAGIALPAARPSALRLRHAQSEDEYPLAPEYAADGGTATVDWPIPRAARLGRYLVEVARGAQWASAGEFRVEHFRVPLVRGTLAAPAAPAIDGAAITLDAQVQYLAGGGAGELPVTLRGLVEPRAVVFDDYPGYLFMNGDVEEGLVDEIDDPWRFRDTRAAAARTTPLPPQAATLDAAGGARFTVSALPPSAAARSLLAELEYPDPNGETLTASVRVPLWPSSVVLGIKPEQWAGARGAVSFSVRALDLTGRPRAGLPVAVDLFQRLTYSHRKRLIGGFYAYEHRQEIMRTEARCAGETDAEGALACTVETPVSGNLILRASASDAAGARSVAQRDVWVAGADDWWYPVGDDDRMDVLPEEKTHEPGTRARLQVRMPFRRATALVTVEREGVLDRFVTVLDGKAPLVEVPLAERYAPNVFVSVLAVRGRDGAIAPTATVDLGRPAWKLGIAEIAVGRRAHTLAVEVATPKPSYRVRETVPVTVTVARADGAALPAAGEVALAVVDEGLLELAPNPSWDLLDAMLGRRGAEVHSATAQMQVIGKRHYGRKAVAPGGGGGAGSGTRSLFDTLLAWQPRVPLDTAGRATVEVPLNDALTRFRIVAVAHAGPAHFGTGSTSVHSTQDVMLFSGLPPLVRAGDRYTAHFTVRNAAARALDLTVGPVLHARDAGGEPVEQASALPPETLTLAAGQARELGFEVEVPGGVARIDWTLRASAAGGPEDRLQVSQRVLPAVPVRTWQGTLQQLSGPLALDLALPADAVPGSGELALAVTPSLAGALAGVRDYMARYPWTCLEQEASRAVVLDDAAAWQALIARLPASLDQRGLARYFAVEGPGSDTLTAHLLALAHAAGWPLPQPVQSRMRDGLVQFIEGRSEVAGAFPAADLSLRKLAAIAALSRTPEGISLAWLEPLAQDLEHWPSSALIDWLEILQRTEDVPERTERRVAALAALRARLDLSGTSLRFSTEAGDALAWLMIDADVNANRALLALLDEPSATDELPRLLRGALARQRNGHWSTTVANAWGVLAARRFAERLEAGPVSGETGARVERGTAGPDAPPEASATITWSAQPGGAELRLPWPPGPARLALEHAGSGTPWLTVQARAAVPLTEPVASGYRIEREIEPVRQAEPGRWRRGDVYRVRLGLSATSDMSWVVVSDPIPAGASILGGGLGRDSGLATAAEPGEAALVRPLFEERTSEDFRAYYDFVPRGEWTLEYTVRLNNPGHFVLPATRVEAMYSPDLFGERPNPPLAVAP